MLFQVKSGYSMLCQFSWG